MSSYKSLRLEKQSPEGFVWVAKVGKFASIQSAYAQYKLLQLICDLCSR